MGRQGMQFGLDEHGRRIKPFKNGRSTCPLCNNILVAHCGDINAWHWQHYKAVDCDSWKEPETAWHRNWKKKWAEAEREVIIQKDGKKHIADIQNKNGIVIEFQNSPISMSTINVRETFYGKMFWVINAKNFVDHLNIWSLVTKELKELEIGHNKSMARDGYFYRTEMEEFGKKIDGLKRKINSSKDQLRNAKSHMESFRKTPSEVSAVAALAINKWNEIKSVYEITNYYSVYGITDYFKQDRLQKQKQRILVSELEVVEKSILQINGAASYRTADNEFKLMDYAELVKLKPVASIAIPKHAQHSMFPVFNAIRSFEQLGSYQHKQAQYLFAMDAKSVLDRLDRERNDILIKMEANLVGVPDYFNLVTEKVKAYYDHNYQLTKKHVDGWQRQIDNYIAELDELDNEMINFQKREEIVRDSMQEESGKELERNRLNAMKRWKGLYGFRWKNERKSWSETGCPVFFDIGEEYLFQRVTPNTLKKVSISTFLNKYNPPGLANINA